MLPLPASVAQNAAGNSVIDAQTFPYFILRPDSKLLDKKNRITALVLTILMGILTLGIGQLVCKLICEIKKYQMNALVDKIINIAKIELDCSKEFLLDAGAVLIALTMGEANLTEADDTTLGNLENLMENLSEEKRALLKSQVQPLIPSIEQMKDIITLPILEIMDQQLGGR